MFRSVAVALLVSRGFALHEVGDALAKLARFRVVKEHGNDTGITKVTSKRGPEDVCACKHWYEVYRTGQVNCSSGLEYHFTGVYPVDEEKRKAKLADAMQHTGEPNWSPSWLYQSDSYCRNVDQTFTDMWWGGQWCYVSNECKELGVAGRKISNTDFAFKICDDRDYSLRTTAPEEIVEMQRRGELHGSLTQLLGFSYVFFQSDLWENIRDDVMRGERSLRGEINTMRELTQPMIVREARSVQLFHPGFKIMYGKKVYSVDLAKRGWEIAMSGNITGLDRLRCIKGC